MTHNNNNVLVCGKSSLICKNSEHKQIAQYLANSSLSMTDYLISYACSDEPLHHCIYSQMGRAQPNFTPVKVYFFVGLFS